jgi:hypothetical protein
MDMVDRMSHQGMPCPHCGASGRFGSCADLFGALLALDHERRQPWGRFHSLNVACYLLQHPAEASESVLAGQWQIVRTFLDGGLDAVEELTRARVRSNRDARPPAPPTPAPKAPDRHPEVTIEDVAVDGTFPAEGYEARMRRWAESVADRPSGD